MPTKITARSVSKPSHLDNDSFLVTSSTTPRLRQEKHKRNATDDLENEHGSTVHKGSSTLLF